MPGWCKDRPELALPPLRLKASLSVVPCRGGEMFLRRLFEALGYDVDATQHQLDQMNPDCGPSRYFTIALAANDR